MGTHSVTLIAPSGREQPVSLNVSKDGVKLSTVENKEINKFPFDIIKKWLPSNLRSKNPGGVNCLDLQIETDKGTRDLRMRCRDGAAVTTIIKKLRDTVQAIMQDLQLQSRSPPHNVGGMPPRQPEDSFNNHTASRMDFEAARLSVDHPQPQASSSLPPPLSSVASQRPPNTQVGAMGSPYRGPPPPQHSSPQTTPPQYRYPSPQQQAQGDIQVAPRGESYLPQYQNHAFDGQGGTPPPPPPYYITRQQDGPGGSSAPNPARGGLVGEGSDPYQPQGNMAQGQSNLEYLSADPQWRSPVRSNAYSLEGVATYPGGHLPAGGPPARVAMGDTEGGHRRVEFAAATSTLGAGSSLLPSRAAPLATPQQSFKIKSMEAQLHEYSSKIEFLEGLVKRLSVELSLVGHTSDSMDAGVDIQMTLQDDNSPFPSWLADQRYLNPLLAAYDKRMAAIDMDMKDRAQQIQALQKQVEEVVKENESLRSELVEQEEVTSRAVAAAAAQRSHAAAQQTFNAAANASGIPFAHAHYAMSPTRAAPVQMMSNPDPLLLEENQLLRQENDLLVAQQNQLDAELQQLHESLEERNRESIMNGRESTHMLAATHQANLRVKELESKLTRAQASMTATDSEIASLEAKLSEAASLADDERMTALTTRRALEELQRQHAALDDELAAAKQKARVALDGQAALQMEVNGLRERCDAISAETSAMSTDTDRLRGALSSMEARLLEYQHKDVDVYGRIKEAMEVAEEARLARDGALARYRELEKDNDSLQQRMASLRQVVRDQVYSELQDQLHEARASTASSQEELALAQHQVSELRAANERQTRDYRSLAAELAGLKEDLGESVSSKSRVSMMSLSAMEKIQDVERERDEAAQKLETTTRRLERATRDWQLQQQNYDNELRSLKHRAAELETSASVSQAEASGSARQLEANAKELQLSKVAYATLEADLRQEIASIRAERDQEVKLLASKLEASMVGCAKSVTEAERMLEAKETLLARWKEEATLVTSKLDRAMSEHRHSLEERQYDVMSLRQQVDALQGENSALSAEVADLKASTANLHHMLDEAEGKAAQYQLQVLSLGNRGEEHQQEVKSLQSMLDRLRFEKSKPSGEMGVQRDDLYAKYDAIKRGSALKPR